MSLAIDQLSLGQIGTNCYLVRARLDATEAVVIDPGDEPAEIERALASHGAVCAAILLTHSHFDHFGALAQLAESTGVPVWLPEAELDVFRRPDRFFPGYPTRAFTGEATPGMLFRFDPDERHSLASDEGARILLLLAPWPGDGHYRGSAA